MVKLLVAALVAMVFAGCAEIATVQQKALDLNATYSNVKRTYIDTKHVLYEIKDDAVIVNQDIKNEKEFWKNEAKTIKEELK